MVIHVLDEEVYVSTYRTSCFLCRLLSVTTFSRQKKRTEKKIIQTWRSAETLESEQQYQDVLRKNNSTRDTNPWKTWLLWNKGKLLLSKIDQENATQKKQGLTFSLGNSVILLFKNSKSLQTLANFTARTNLKWNDFLPLGVISKVRDRNDNWSLVVQEKLIKTSGRVCLHWRESTLSHGSRRP